MRETCEFTARLVLPQLAEFCSGGASEHDHQSEPEGNVDGLQNREHR